jgi:PHD/YefM family antitoxin component YafN of YafNO toxin-antitoxin module
MAKRGAVILTRNGKPVASLNDISRSDWESISLANNPRFQAMINESRRVFRETGGTRLEDLREELGLPARSRKRSK